MSTMLFFMKISMKKNNSNLLKVSLKMEIRLFANSTNHYMGLKSL